MKKERKFIIYFSIFLVIGVVGIWALFTILIGNLFSNWEIGSNIEFSPPSISVQKSIIFMNEDEYKNVVINVGNSDFPLLAKSNNQMLLPNSGLMWVDNSGDTRTLRIYPVANKSGIAAINLTGWGRNQEIKSITLAVNISAADDLPEISLPGPISKRWVIPRNVTSNYEFDVKDIDDPVSEILFDVYSSSNQSVIPILNITFIGTGEHRRIAITPVPGVSGESLVVPRSNYKHVVETYHYLHVIVNEAPKIDVIGRDANVAKDLSGEMFCFNYSDTETPKDQLSVSVECMNKELVEKCTILNNSSRLIGTDYLTIDVDLKDGKTGDSDIVVSVSDGISQTSETFYLRVFPDNYAPVIGQTQYLHIDQTINSSGYSTRIPFRVWDDSTIPRNLFVAARSLHQGAISDSNISVSGTGNLRWLMVRPNSIETLAKWNFIELMVTDDSIPPKTSLRIIYYDLIPGTLAYDKFPVFSSLPKNRTGIRSLAEDFGEEVIYFNVSYPDANYRPILVFYGDPDNDTIISRKNIREEYNETRSGYQMKIYSEKNQFGLTNITVKVTDGNFESSFVVWVNVSSVNDIPVVSHIPDQITDEDTPITVDFNITDEDTPESEISITGLFNSSMISRLSSWKEIYPDGKIKGRVEVIPKANKFGKSIISLKINDSDNVAYTEFNLTISPIPDPPKVAFYDTLIYSIGEDEVLKVPLIVESIDLPFESMEANVDYISNLNVVKPEFVRFASDGGLDTSALYVMPQPDATGTVDIGFNIGNGSLFSNANSIRVNVLPVNDAPAITHIDDGIIKVNSQDPIFYFNISDVDNSTDQLEVSVEPSGVGIYSHLELSGTGKERMLNLGLNYNALGNLNITVYVSDGEFTSSETFRIDVVPEITRLTVNLIGTGGGHVTSEDGWINCDGHDKTCFADYSSDSNVILKIHQDEESEINMHGSSFSCDYFSDLADVCSFSMIRDREINVSFSDVTPPLADFEISEKEIFLSLGIAQRIILTAEATDKYGVVKADFYRNGILTGTNSTPSGNTFTWTDSVSEQGTYSYSIEVTDMNGNVNYIQKILVLRAMTDEDMDGVVDDADYCLGTKNFPKGVSTMGCPLPITNKFDVIYPNLSINDLDFVSNFTLGVGRFGNVSFGSSELSLMREENGIKYPLDIDEGLEIGDKFITLNPAKLNILNRNANISLTIGLMVSPQVQRDGVNCTDCRILSYRHGVIEFWVPHFSTYSVVENDSTAIAEAGNICGDGIKNSTEQCESGVSSSLTCANYGYSRGNLACVNCNIVTSGCNNGGGNNNDGGGGGGDSTAPTISAVSASMITANSAVISWTTNEVSDSRVDYGLTNAYGFNAYSGVKVLAHSNALIGLLPSTTYHYKITSKDTKGNSRSLLDMTFMTLPASQGQGGQQLGGNPINTCLGNGGRCSESCDLSMEEISMEFTCEQSGYSCCIAKSNEGNKDNKIYFVFWVIVIVLVLGILAVSYFTLREIEHGYSKKWLNWLPWKKSE